MMLTAPVTISDGQVELTKVYNICAVASWLEQAALRKESPVWSMRSLVWWSCVENRA
jgi:hypothetical protein